MNEVPPQLPAASVGLPAVQAEWTVAQFLDLEMRLDDILAMVPYIQPNLTTVIPRLASIIVDAGTLVDSICKAVTSSRMAKSKPNIKDFAADLESHCRLSGLNTLLFSYPPAMLTPFAEWSNLSKDGRPSPAWWMTYNDLKHDRLARLDGSTLANAILATCGVHQLVASSADFYVPLLRHDVLRTNMNPQLWVSCALKGAIAESDAMVESKLFVITPSMKCLTVLDVTPEYPYTLSP